MPKPVPVDLHKIVISETTDMQVIVLREQGGNRILPIWIGTGEAMAIRRKIQGEIPPRPMTHDLLADALQKCGAMLSRVVIDKFVSSQGGGTFHAKIWLKQGDASIEVDSRPSDAIALAVRLSAPIFVDDRILTEEGHDAARVEGAAGGAAAPGAWTDEDWQEVGEGAEEEDDDTEGDEDTEEEENDDA